MQSSTNSAAQGTNKKAAGSILFPTSHVLLILLVAEWQLPLQAPQPHSREKEGNNQEEEALPIMSGKQNFHS